MSWLRRSAVVLAVGMLVVSACLVAVGLRSLSGPTEAPQVAAQEKFMPAVAPKEDAVTPFVDRARPSRANPLVPVQGP